MSKKKSGIRLKDFVETYGLEDRVDEIKSVLREWRSKNISQVTQYIEEEDKDFLIDYYELSGAVLVEETPKIVAKEVEKEHVKSTKSQKPTSKRPQQKPIQASKKQEPPARKPEIKQETKDQVVIPEPKKEEQSSAPVLLETSKPVESKPVAEEKPEEKIVEEKMEQDKPIEKPEEHMHKVVEENIAKEQPKQEPLTEVKPIEEKQSVQEKVKEEPIQVKAEKQEKVETKQESPKAPSQKPKKEPQKPSPPKEEAKKEEEIKIIEIPEVISVREFAELLGVGPNQIIKELFQEGILVTINQNIDPNLAVKIAEKFGYLAEIKKPEVVIEEEEPEEEDPSKLKPRPPVVVVMGHVDHGKTTLLDTIRKTNVAAREKGGITQHIGASMVKTKDGRLITFLDTPGHEAFTSLRARGAQVTDVAILVVAADDGVMPQTIEAINHAKAFNVPIVVAVNKIDKPGADPSRVRRELSEVGIIPEEWGGDTVFVDVSAKTGQGVDELLDMVMLVADMLELKANPDKKAKGTIIESRLDKQKGPVATVLVTEGTLKVGDIFVAGATYGRVRAMMDSYGHKVKQATPSMAVEIIGFEEVPEAGDVLKVVDSEKQAKELAQIRKTAKEQDKNKELGISLDDIFKKIKEGEVKELKLIVKADAVGSLEAIKKSLSDIKTSEVSIKVIHEGVGSITEGDVMLAKAAKAIILGFNVRPDAKAKEAAEREKVDIRVYGIIYELLDDVKKAISGMLSPVKKEITLGLAEVRATFKVKGAGTVAGCYVLEGKIVRNQRARLIRNGVVIYDGKIESLKRFKEDVNEVARGYECGIKLENYNDIKVKDEIECYEIKEEKQTL
ncbi:MULTISPECIES: translation initiation factor IF-2 [unclassified Hydrogenobaculum]|uniref:translation initiation factor IF-2 n=1 Tax=unclassified Hydrogenobaculum TaxID=2622382 RepID=UPI0001C521F5|nr:MULTISPECIES: translation initiation factor IF-2 [unclassified Hydrogenobaculum]AEF19389.1 translation initiation factor IF-2 [Hydrogenobaculum sp. 3684]AEG46678.1 translation initiation factor IF-2 [Hydrogenobaculum sp. SHO]AGG15322.1 translation initiation factor IF-2 [Hydrogenobaculum sp. HO]AGH93624.1 translation initiation factor IF-2 [Hydrogenobaculum sp. SN]